MNTATSARLQGGELSSRWHLQTVEDALWIVPQCVVVLFTPRILDNVSLQGDDECFRFPEIVETFPTFLVSISIRNV